jgi:biotin operon repressor
MSTSGNIVRLLRTLACIDRRSFDGIGALIGSSRATIKRDLSTLRALGCVITYDRVCNYYRVESSSVIDIAALRRHLINL